MERVKGLEPSASTLARSRSSQLSYTRIPKGAIVLHTKKAGVKRDFPDKVYATSLRISAKFGES